MSPRGTRAWRWIAGSVAALAIVSALAVGALRLALESLPEYELRIAEQVRTATGLRLSFDSLDARIGRYGPEIYFEGARIVDPEGEVLVVAQAGRASLALLRSAWFRRLEIGRVTLESPHLNLLIFPDRHVELVGQAGFARPPSEPRSRRGLDRVPRGHIEVHDATLRFLDLGAGGASWELTSVDVELRRHGGTIELEGDVSLPDRLGRSVEFSGELSGDLATPASIDWRGRVVATDVDLAGWARLLPDTFRVPSAGSGSFRVSARGTGRSLRRGRVVMQMTGVALPTPAPAMPLTYDRLAGDVVVERTASGWRLAGQQLELSLRGSRWQPDDVEAALTLKDGRVTDVTARAGYLRIENLVPLLELARDARVRERMAAIAPRGVLRDVDIRVTPAGPQQMPDLAGTAEFEDLGFAPVGRFPGVSGLDGSLAGRGGSTVVHLDAAAVTLEWPAKWRTARRFTTIRGTVELQRALGGLRIACDDAFVAAGHGEASGRVRVLARPRQTPLLDIAARARLSDLAAVAGYLPRDRLSEKALAWLDAAFPAGRVGDARVEITGPVTGFPYREGQGRFHAEADVEGATLVYARGWQPVTGIAGRVAFDGAAMRISGASGSLGNLTLRDAAAEVADWRNSVVVVRSSAVGDAADVYRFFRSSPLAPRLGATFGRLGAAGPVEGLVAMYLPIKQFADRVFSVQGRARGVSLGLAGLREQATAVSGDFWVRNREFHAPLLTASLLGGPAQASVVSRTADNGDVETRVEANGTLEGSRLPNVVRLPLDSGLAGATSWRAVWTLSRPSSPDRDAASRVLVDSDLVGLASGLPAPLDKPAGESRPLRLQVDAGGSGDVVVRASLGRALRALVELRRGEERLQVTRGTIRLGGGEVSVLPVAPGLGLDGRLPYLSLSDWTGLRWPGPPRQRLEDLVAAATLEVGRLEVLGYEFAGVSGRLRPGNRAWDIEVSSPDAQGRLRVPYGFPGEVPLVADLDRLSVTSRARAGGGDTDPRRLPGMRIDVRDLTFSGWRLGHLSARLEHTDDGLELEEFSARHAAFTASGSGGWRVAPRGTESALRVNVDSGDVKGFLEAMALAPVIEARNGRLEADVTWPRGPDARLLERVSGRVRIALTAGRVLTVEPGAGRILGLMSLAHLGKRLALDFDDLTGQGLAFDTIKGDFSLTSGEAYTDNLTLRGPVAEVGIAGRTSLAARTYDQTAVVTGDIGASLGVAGVIAGGPAVGAAMLLFSQIFKEPLKGVARAYYRITGPWDNPAVRKIDARKLEEAAGPGSPPPAGDKAGEAG